MVSDLSFQSMTMRIDTHPFSSPVGTNIFSSLSWQYEFVSGKKSKQPVLLHMDVFPLWFLMYVKGVCGRKIREYIKSTLCLC